MTNINTHSGVFYDVSQELFEDYSERKSASRKYSDQNTDYFRSLMVESQSCSEERKEEIEGIFKRSQKQHNCSRHVQHILAHGKNAEGDIKTERKLLDNKSCSLKKSCPICAAAEGLKMVTKLISYFSENEGVIAYPFTISPENYSGITMRDRVMAGHHGTESIYKKFKEATKKCFDSRSRGNAESQLVIEQLKENMTGCYFSKEFEPGQYQKGFNSYLMKKGYQKFEFCENIDFRYPASLKAMKEAYPELTKYSRRVLQGAHSAGLKNEQTVNCHWHGILFMKLDESGQYKNTLDYKSFRSFIEWCNGGKPCQVEIGHTKGDKRPIQSTGDEKQVDKAAKAFLEVTKYITKMPTKNENEYDFNKRQSLIWEVSAATYRFNFVKQGGDLVKYQPNIDISMWKPHELAHHGLVYESTSYQQYLNPIGDDYVSESWFEVIRLEYVRYLKDDLQNRIYMSEDSKFLKRAMIQKKAYITEIQNLIERIQYRQEIKLKAGGENGIKIE